MAAVVSASPEQPILELPPPEGPSSTKVPAFAPADKSAKLRQASKREDSWRPDAVMLGHWHKRTWDLAHQLNVDGRCRCIAAVTDMRDALVVLQAAIPAAELLICSSYELEDIQELLLDYEGDMKILVAPPNMMNTGGAVTVAEWAGNMIDARSFSPKSGVLSPTGYMRRLSATSSGSGSGV
ncbi:hypothetical protein JCM6882_007422 [Rhodosporidiobolus microsporus]